VILVWVQNWNISEELMKLYSPPDYFHQKTCLTNNYFHVIQLRDSSMSTKLKYFWKTHEIVKSARILSQKHVSRTISFHVIHIMWF